MRVAVPRRACLLALAVSALAAVPGESLTLRPPRLGRERMEAAFAEGGRFLVVYGTREPAAAALLRSQALAVARRVPQGDTSDVVADRDLSAAALAARHVILLGGPRENLWSLRLAPALPVTFAPGTFRWQGTEYRRPDDVLHLVWPHPLDPGRFLVLLAANSVEAYRGRPGRVHLGARDWRIYRGGELARSGVFAHGGGRVWRYDPALDRDLEAARDGFERSLLATGTGPVRLRAPPGTVAGGAVLAAAEAVVARMDALGFAAPGDGPLVLTLHPSLEAKGLVTRDTRPEHLDGGGAAHAAFPAGREALDLWSVAAARLRGPGAAADAPWLAAAATWLAGRCDGEPLETAVARLVRAGLLPAAAAAAEVMDDPDRTIAAGRWRSPLVLRPARALLMRAVHETAGARGPAAVRSVIAAPAPATLAALCARAGVPRAALERRYASLAESLGRSGAAATAARAPRRWRPADGFQTGVCLAHTVGLEGGYLSASCARELARLKAEGAGWVSLTPFGYLPSRTTPDIVPGSEGGPGEETDEAVCEAAARARALGMRVWLKPHLWTRGFVGELEFDPEGWERFFARYREFILHHALLAEREGMDGLVIGHELTTATLGHPGRWRALIAEVRRVYRGTLTYGANWGAEVRDVEFWDALDVIGVSLYTPLADTPTRDPARLRAGARRALAELGTVARRTGRPVVILEAGYAPHTGAPVRPWEERGGTHDPATQRACYEALVAALGPEPWVAGLFWWKWFSDDAAGGPADGSFTPRGKPAEAVMMRAFREWRARAVSAPPAPAGAPVRPGPP